MSGVRAKKIDQRLLPGRLLKNKWRYWLKYMNDKGFEYEAGEAETQLEYLLRYPSSERLLIIDSTMQQGLKYFTTLLMFNYKKL